MIYLLRVVNRSIQIAACENDKRVPALLTRGYKVVTRAQYILAWQKRDWLAARVILTTSQVPSKERTVGAGWTIGDIWKKQ